MKDQPLSDVGSGEDSAHHASRVSSARVDGRGASGSAEISLYVVNMRNSRERRASMEAQADALALDLIFFEAIDGRAPHPLFAHVNERARQAYKGRPFRPGELGCWASHHLLWQRCVDSQRPIIVLEDDVRLDERLTDVMRALPLMPADVGYFRLHAANTASAPWRRFGDFVLHRYWRSPMCTFGYYLTPAAAAAFLRHADKWIIPVDDYMDLAWLHGVPCLGLKPGVVSSGDVFESTIRTDGKKKSRVGPWGWLTREAYRAWLSIRWFAHNLPARLQGARLPE